jgi:hypothetical protein
LPRIIILTSIKLIVANINVSTGGAMTFDQRQSGEGDGDIDADISDIVRATSPGSRSQSHAKT